jgi:hypothetical protein
MDATPSRRAISVNDGTARVTERRHDGWASPCHPIRTIATDPIGAPEYDR